MIRRNEWIYDSQAIGERAEGQECNEAAGTKYAGTKEVNASASRPQYADGMARRKGHRAFETTRRERKKTKEPLSESKDKTGSMVAFAAAPTKQTAHCPAVGSRRVRIRFSDLRS